MTRCQRRAARGMHTAEYAICFGLVVAAAVGMQTYVKRALQARVKTGTDLMVDASSGTIEGQALDTISQYEPYYDSSARTTDRSSRIQESRDEHGVLTRKEATRQTGRQNSVQGETGAANGALDKDNLWDTSKR